MAEIEIISVTRGRMLEKELWGRHISRPKPGTRVDGYSLDFAGWIVAKGSSVVAIEVSGVGVDARRFNVNIRRPDVMQKFPEAPQNTRPGFRGSVSLLPYSHEFELSIHAVIKGKKPILLSTIKGRRSRLKVAFSPKFQPLMLTNLGRSGSTWVTRLLGQHPQIVTYKPFLKEPRIAGYWMEVFKALSEPSSYLQSLVANVSDKHWWLGDSRKSPFPAMTAEPEMRRLFGETHVQVLAGFFMERIDEFYQAAAKAEGHEGAIYFSERLFGISAFATAMCWELYAKPREIVLVRDFRDMLCSIFAFDAKLGLRRFGRDGAASDEEYVTKQLPKRVRGLLKQWKDRKDKVHLLRYEDLVLRPEETFKATLQYLELDSSDEVVAQTIQRASELTPELQKKHQTSAGPVQSIGRWRKDLSPSLQKLCMESIGKELAEFGYTDGL
jgi:hypothetical protein